MASGRCALSRKRRVIAKYGRKYSTGDTSVEAGAVDTMFLA